MTNNHEESKKKLIGWKMIARHLGRSERAVQFWEEQRGLPIHRIPGTRGHTVYAFVAELDSWMSGSGAATANDTIIPLQTALVTELNIVDPFPSLKAGRDIRPPGILVLPVERRPGIETVCSAEALCQQLIVRMSAAQPVRVLSWSTSRSIQQSVESIAAITSRLNVRYLVESDVERANEGLLVDVRIVDAEIDQIVLADRFIVREGSCSAGYAELAGCVALHFALIHAGALVEPICLSDLDPGHFLAYLNAVQTFFDDAHGTAERTLAELDRTLELAPLFAPALAMRGLALVLRAESPTSPLMDEARRIFAGCRDQVAARVTTAFLGAAIARRTEAVGKDAVARMVLRWIPPASGRSGRLYERRSALTHREGRPADADHFERRRQASNDGHPLLEALLKALVATHAHPVIETPSARDGASVFEAHHAASVSNLLSGRAPRHEADG